MQKDLGARTKPYARRVIRLYSALPKSTVAHVLGKQLLRSGTSVGANYREADRARSKQLACGKTRAAARRNAGTNRDLRHHHKERETQQLSPRMPILHSPFCILHSAFRILHSDA